jgi:hypothetical protein
MSNQIQEILTEWTYRLPKGYPTEIKDYDVLRDILREMSDLPDDDQEHIVRRAMGVDESANTTLTESSADYDLAIRQRLGLEPDAEIPQVQGQYNLGRGPLPLNSHDAEIVKKLWPETMNLAIIGKGEIAIYWLYQYQNPSIETFDNRGDDLPDLKIDGENVEIKSYDSHNERISLGRFQKFKETRKLVSIVFGIHTLANTFNPDESAKVYSDLAFTGTDLTDAFQTFIAVDLLPAKLQLIESFPIFQSLFSQIDLVKQQLRLQEDTYEPTAAAAELLKTILREKLEIKPGDNGYIINTRSKNPADIYTYQIDFQAIDNESVLNNVVVNGGVIQVNYKNIFGAEKG